MPVYAIRAADDLETSRKCGDTNVREIINALLISLSLWAVIGALARVLL